MLVVAAEAEVAVVAVLAVLVVSGARLLKLTRRGSISNMAPGGCATELSVRCSARWAGFELGEEVVVVEEGI